MALVLQDKDTPPPERWSYPGIGGILIDAGNWNQLLENVRKHFDANTQSVPSEQAIIDWVCEHLRTRCYESHTRIPLVNKIGLPFTPTRACCGDRK